MRTGSSPARQPPPTIVGEIHLYQRDLSSVDAAELADDHRMLPIRERAEFDRVIHEPTRRVRMVARALLRRSVSSLTGMPPRLVPLRRTQAGALVLSASVGLHVSVSHTASRCVVALAPRPVGVDVRRSDERPLEELAAIFMHADERAGLVGHPAAVRAAMLLSLWTGKEAVAKHAGLGFREGGPETFVFAVPPHGGVPEYRGRASAGGRGGTDGDICPPAVVWLQPDPEHLIALACVAELASAESAGSAEPAGVPAPARPVSPTAAGGRLGPG